MVPQPYEAEADNEYVIRGNAALMKCEVPSFVSDFVSVEMWMDSNGGTYQPGGNEGISSHHIKHTLSLIPIFFSQLSFKIMKLESTMSLFCEAIMLF